MSSAQVILAILLAAAVTYTVLGYPHRYGALTGRSRLYRTVSLFLLSLLLLLVFMGTFIDFYADVGRKIGTIRQLFYWFSCILLGLIVPAMALLDTLESLVAVRREKRDYLMNMWHQDQERQSSTMTGHKPSHTDEQQSTEQHNKRG
jgi:ABC-type amino acid transport system permease subunit